MLTLPARSLFFLCALTGGTAVLALEVSGARMLTPYFGSSHFVWTAQIEVTLLALALGYWLGGRISAHAPESGLAAAVILAGAFTVFAPFLLRAVSLHCLRVGLPLGSFCASGLLFFIPLALLATLGPILVHLLSEGVATVGTTAGKVGFVSTLGSALGAVVSGYASYANRFYLIGTGACLAVLGCMLLARWRRSWWAIPLLMIALLSGGLAWAGVKNWPEWQFARAVEIDNANSPFGTVQVLSLPGTSTYLYLNDFLVVNTYDVKLKQGQDAYTHLLRLLAMTYTGKIHDALCIGMAAGIVPMDLAKADVRVEAVEINPAAVRFARKYFDLDTNRVGVLVEDGRYVLNRISRKFDLVILDAYLGESAPNHLLSREAFQQMARILNPGGTLVISSAAAADGSSGFFLASVQKTLRTVFDHVRIHDTHSGNAFFVASMTPLATRNEVSLETVPPSLRWIIKRTLARGRDAEPAHGMVITDDFNPLDFHEARNRQAIRRRILEHLQTL